MSMGHVTVPLAFHVYGGELPLRLGDGELVELQLRLLAEIRAVHQEQDPLGVGVLDEPVADVGGGGERVSAPVNS